MCQGGPCEADFLTELLFLPFAGEMCSERLVCNVSALNSHRITENAELEGTIKSNSWPYAGMQGTPCA